MQIKFLSMLAGAFVAAASVTVAPQAMAEQVVWTKGEVTKIDKEQGKVTVRHAEITNLDMPAMRMIFRVADPKMIETLKVGQKGEFYFIDNNGRLMIKQIK